MLPTNPWTTGLPTVPSHRFAWMQTTSKPQPVLLDDAVDAAVARTPDPLTGVGQRAAVSHADSSLTTISSKNSGDAIFSRPSISSARALRSVL